MIKEEKWRLSDIVTGDKSWFYHRHIAKRESNKNWVYESEKPKTVVRQIVKAFTSLKPSYSGEYKFFGKMKDH